MDTEPRPTCTPRAARRRWVAPVVFGFAMAVLLWFAGSESAGAEGPPPPSPGPAAVAPVVQPVQDLVGQVDAALRETLAPAQQVVSPVVQPVVTALATTVQPVIDLVQPVGDALPTVPTLPASPAIPTPTPADPVAVPATPAPAAPVAERTLPEPTFALPSIDFDRPATRPLESAADLRGAPSADDPTPPATIAGTPAETAASAPVRGPAPFPSAPVAPTAPVAAGAGSTSGSPLVRTADAGVDGVLPGHPTTDLVGSEVVADRVRAARSIPTGSPPVAPD